MGSDPEALSSLHIVVVEDDPNARSILRELVDAVMTAAKRP